MYFPYFITYMALGFGISLVVFFWALKNGQFKDQKRARFLPLEKETDTPAAGITRFNRYEAYGLLFLAFAGLAASAAVLVFSLLNGKYF
ncbi:MAG: cbb3-type cytochrome oxidase assembly protein CcoS [Deltaproteobacteria bacterium]|jgi:cbb3-type cytochrome oxidase maturation protein|nr:cbb3-type cytochrome oxidase assembly protein CcoS [Deltaproteobacteria bacterium]